MARNAPALPPEIALEIKQGFQADGDARKAVIAKYTAPPYGWSRSKVYGIAKTHGWQSGRKARTDKGEIRIPGITEGLIEHAVKVQLEATRRKTGKGLICSEDTLLQLQLNGHDAMQHVKPATFNRWKRERKLDHAQLQAGNPAIEMQSLYPNHIHFVDASICVQWDLNGRKKMVPRDMQKAFYKNKPGYWKQVRKVLVRWLVVDHNSGAFYVDYTYAGGENTADLLNVLLDAWDRKEYADQYPFHGVPRMLGMDPGAANTSYEVKTLAEKLADEQGGIELYVHAPGNSKASGSVEQAHSWWETRFEWELLLKLADDLDDLRARARDRMIYLNAVPEHGRHGKTRNAKWLEIREEQLRLMPPKEHCQKLATSKPETRVPDERLRISFEGREYQLSAPALKQVKVNVDRHPWQADDLNVWTDEGETVPCRLIVKNEHGFDETAPVFGEGKYQRHQDTPAEALKRRFEAEDKRTRLNGFEPKPTAHLVPEQRFFSPRGTPMETELPKAPPIKRTEVPGQLRKELGIERITPLMKQRLNQLMGDRDLFSQDEFKALAGKAAAAFGARAPTQKTETTRRNAG